MKKPSMKDYKPILVECLRKTINEPGFSIFQENSNETICYYENGKLYKSRMIHEQAITHRLSVYLELSNVFSGYTIDCEYNRHLYHTKKTDSNGDTFRPDIIIHERRTDQNNLIYIEVKQQDSHIFNSKNDTIEYISKMKYRKKLYNYQFAYLIIIPAINIETLERYVIDVCDQNLNENGLLEFIK